MARGRRRPAVQPAVVLHGDLNNLDGAVLSDDNHDVDEFVRRRHESMAEKMKLVSDSLSSDEDDISIPNSRSVPSRNLTGERMGAEIGVLDVDVSDSEESDGNEDLIDEDAEADAMPESDGKWGGRRRMWYGGDTHDYEIMEDDERDEALRDEEEEARRLQSKALSKMVVEDFLDEEESAPNLSATTQGKLVDVGRGNVTFQQREDSELESAPELPSLLYDLQQCLTSLRNYKLNANKNFSWCARLKYHISASYAETIALYLALRSDPEAELVDICSHPVIADIVRFQSLRKKCEHLMPEDESISDTERKASLTAADRASILDDHILLQNSTDTAAISKNNSGGNILKESGEKKKRDRKTRSRNKNDDAKEAGPTDDARFLRNVIGSMTAGEQVPDSRRGEHGAEKRRKFNLLVGTLERDRQNRDARRIVSTDVQLQHPDKVISKNQPSIPEEFCQDKASVIKTDLNRDTESLHEEQQFMQHVLPGERKEKKNAAQGNQKEMKQAHNYTFDDRIKDKDIRRRANAQIVLNRGLTRYRPRDRKTPRTKNREAFSKAIKKRRSVVRDPVSAKPISYGGEASGINMSARKSSRVSGI